MIGSHTVVRILLEDMLVRPGVRDAQPGEKLRELLLRILVWRQHAVHRRESRHRVHGTYQTYCHGVNEALQPVVVSRVGRARGLLLACHPVPTAGVAAISTLLATGVGLPAARVVVLGLAVLTGQLSIGWSNDRIDARRDAMTARADKPPRPAGCRCTSSRSLPLRRWWRHSRSRSRWDRSQRRRY